MPCLTWHTGHWMNKNPSTDKHHQNDPNWMASVIQHGLYVRNNIQFSRKKDSSSLLRPQTAAGCWKRRTGTFTGTGFSTEQFLLQIHQVAHTQAQMEIRITSAPAAAMKNYTRVQDSKSKHAGMAGPNFCCQQSPARNRITKQHKTTQNNTKRHEHHAPSTSPMIQVWRDSTDSKQNEPREKHTHETSHFFLLLYFFPVSASSYRLLVNNLNRK